MLFGHQKLILKTHFQKIKSMSKLVILKDFSNYLSLFIKGQIMYIIIFIK